MDQSLFTARGGEGGGVVEVSFLSLVVRKKLTRSFLARSSYSSQLLEKKKLYTLISHDNLFFFSSKVVVIQCVVQDDNTRALLIFILGTLFSLFKSSL